MPAVPKKRTSLTRQQVLDVLAPALAKRGVTNPRTVGMLAGIVGIENGGGRLIHNHNWGNVMATKGWVDSGRDYWERPHSDPGQPQRFRALSSHSEGADRWAALITGERHRPVLEPAAAGDAEGMNASLFRTAYIVPAVGPRVRKSVEQQKEEYRAGIERHAKQYLKLLGVEQTPPAEPAIPPAPAVPPSLPPDPKGVRPELSPAFFLRPESLPSAGSLTFGGAGVE